MLVHGRGSYPRIGWFDSIDCDDATRSLVEALHAKKRCPSTGGASSQHRRLLHSSVGSFLSVSYSGQYFRLSNGKHGFDSRHRYFSRDHSSKPYTHAARQSSSEGKPSRLRHSDAQKISLARRGASGEAMTNSANRASVRSLGANERWVRVPPPRLS
jgi:hypothetical protein